MGMPDYPVLQGPINPAEFKCECVCVEVQKILDAQKQRECQVFMRDIEFEDCTPTLPLIDEHLSPIPGVNWKTDDPITVTDANFIQNNGTQIFVIEKPPQNYTVTPLVGSDPPAAEIQVVVTPGTDPTTTVGPCQVKNTVLVRLENARSGAHPEYGYLEVCPIQFSKSVVLFYPDPGQVGLVDVKTESAWEILEQDVEVIVDVLRLTVTVGAFVIVKTWADAQLVMTAFGECDWEQVPPPLADEPCLQFFERPFPRFNPAQLSDFFIPPSPNSSNGDSE